jgi:hypothetical protein
MELNTAGHKSPVFRGTSRASLYPSMIDEAIIEEENEEDIKITEGACISICRVLLYMCPVLGSGCRCYHSINIKVALPSRVA